MEMNKLHCCKVISQSHWSLPLMDNKPKKSDLVHQTVSRREAHGLGMSLIETAHSVKNGASTKSREHFLRLLVLYKKETSFSASVDKAFFLQPAKTAAMCTECHDYARPPPTFCSTKLISKTN